MLLQQLKLNTKIRKWIFSGRVTDCIYSRQNAGWSETCMPEFPSQRYKRNDRQRV